MRFGALLAAAVLIGTATAACEGAFPSGSDEPDRAALAAPFGEPLPGIDASARARFERGRAVAARRFAPSGGLGPIYNGVACVSCHEKPVIGGGASRYRTVFAGAGASDTFTVPFEQHFTVASVSRDVRGTRSVMRTPPAFFGIGLLAEVPFEAIIARADPNDRDGDGIRGRVNFERGFVGRFGRKAQMASLQGFVRLALIDHMGITTDPVEPDFLSHGELPRELATRDLDAIADPELSPSDLEDLLAFVALLAPPSPDPPTATTRAGEARFLEIGCGACHVPSLPGPRGDVFAYTDLLLHDMGEELADGVEVGEAKGREYRTTPLWGLAAAGPYLHDGRADTIDEAVRAHGGEARASAERFASLGEAERTTVLAFLRSLGGADRKSDGLLPPGAPIPAAFELGGSMGPMSPEDAARFASGRDAFDHDFSRAEGVGPRFNGDACRSCHFDPVIGGAGPADVDVVRHGLLLPDGTSAPPPGGETFAPRFDLLGGRPPIDPGVVVFERRQTPTLLGLGLVDLVSDEAILGRTDEADRDGDGVRGVASVLTDGRIGRFGWKAHAATLDDFVRDAFDKELGIDAGELDESRLRDLMFYLSRLAPPRRGTEGDEERLGRAAFERIGCASCHVPALPTRDGREVALFSDLLLHDVAPPGARFVPQGPERLFRTPPLWGVAATPPYFHDGQAETLDAAIRRHDAEGAASRDRFLQATDAERRALLAFLRAL